MRSLPSYRRLVHQWRVTFPGIDPVSGRRVCQTRSRDGEIAPSGGPDLASPTRRRRPPLWRAGRVDRSASGPPPSSDHRSGTRSAENATNATAAEPAAGPGRGGAHGHSEQCAPAWRVSSATGVLPGAAAINARVRAHVEAQTASPLLSRSAARHPAVVGDVSTRAAAGSSSVVATAAAAAVATSCARTMNEPASADGWVTRCCTMTTTASTAAPSGARHGIDRPWAARRWRTCGSSRLTKRAAS